MCMVKCFPTCVRAFRDQSPNQSTTQRLNSAGDVAADDTELPSFVKAKKKAQGELDRLSKTNAELAIVLKLSPAWSRVLEIESFCHRDCRPLDSLPSADRAKVTRKKTLRRYIAAAEKQRATVASKGAASRKRGAADDMVSSLGFPACPDAHVRLE